MKKTAGLVALSFAVAAAGCALVPQQALKNVGGGSKVSGPVTFYIPNVPAVRGVQAVDASIKQVEVVVYKAASWTTTKGSGATNPYNNRATVAQDPFKGTPLVATASVTPGTYTAITIPALPVGSFVVQANLYTDSRNHYTATTGLPTADAPIYIAAQTEAAVTAVPGAPVSATFTLYNTFASKFNIDCSTYLRGATNSTILTSAQLLGLANALNKDTVNIRLANFNAYTQVATLSATNHVVRLAIVPESGDLPDDAASDSLTTSDSPAGWAVYDVNGTSGTPATSSFGTWKWATDADPAVTATYSMMYCDVDLGTGAALKPLFHAVSPWNSSLRTGNLSLVLPYDLINNPGASVSVMLIDLASGSSATSQGTF